MEVGMKKFAWLAVFAFAFCMVAIASEKVAALDGTSWKIDVAPDAMAKTKGEKDYKEVLTFADGMVSMDEGQKVGFASSPYEVEKSGEKDWTFKTKQESESTGRSVWTAAIHEKSMKGKLIITKNGGAVLTYTFEGNKLD
jgi:hypothetical protein